MNNTNKPNKWKVYIFATVASFLFAFTSFKFEVDLTEIVVDAQAAIIVVFSFIFNSIIWILLTISVSKLILGCFRKQKTSVIIAGVFVAGLLCIVVFSIASSIGKRDALVDSQNIESTQERLRELVGYQSGFGYEIDNRLARNPSTPIDILEKLYNIEGQVGTKMSLALNPNTPNHILIKLSKRQDDWRGNILDRLQHNPKIKNSELAFDSEMVLYETKKLY